MIVIVAITTTIAISMISTTSISPPHPSGATRTDPFVFRQPSISLIAIIIWRSGSSEFERDVGSWLPGSRCSGICWSIRGGWTFLAFYAEINMGVGWQTRWWCRRWWTGMRMRSVRCRSGWTCFHRWTCCGRYVDTRRSMQSYRRRWFRSTIRRWRCRSSDDWFELWMMRRRRSRHVIVRAEVVETPTWISFDEGRR